MNFRSVVPSYLVVGPFFAALLAALGTKVANDAYDSTLVSQQLFE